VSFVSGCIFNINNASTREVKMHYETRGLPEDAINCEDFRMARGGGTELECDMFNDDYEYSGCLHTFPATDSNPAERGIWITWDMEEDYNRFIGFRPVRTVKNNQ
jgi:hypothetical protein